MTYGPALFIVAMVFFIAAKTNDMELGLCKLKPLNYYTNEIVTPVLGYYVGNVCESNLCTDVAENVLALGVLGLKLSLVTVADNGVVATREFKVFV